MIIATVLIYFAVLLTVSHLTTRHNSGNAAFFSGNRNSPWYLVSIGMVGASISGITFVSVPGMVLHSDMTYLQTCLGFILGYLSVAYVLLPIYYRLGVTTIYSILKSIGTSAYKTGATFFILSKLTGAAARLYVPCYIIATIGVSQLSQKPLTADAESLIVVAVAVLMVLLIWIYTHVGGIRTLVWTDTLQTICMFVALLLIIYKVSEALYPTLHGIAAAKEAFRQVFADSHSRIFVFDDWDSPRHFAKSFLSGIFIVIVMTGLDQDMMQKNLSCRNLPEAQRNMCCYGLTFLPANLLFLCLGVMLMMLCRQWGEALPENPDSLMTMFAATGRLGTTTLALFSLGIVAAAFSSADSSLTALTTSFCVDLCGKPSDERLRKRVHLGMSVAFVGFVVLFHLCNSTSLIDAIYILCSYTYGPLLGLFAFCLIHGKSGRKPKGSLVPVVCLASPAICYALSTLVPRLTGYHFGYELLMLNGLLTYLGLLLFLRKPHCSPTEAP